MVFVDIGMCMVFGLKCLFAYLKTEYIFLVVFGSVLRVRQHQFW